jgi:hypothetical protein
VPQGPRPRWLFSLGWQGDFGRDIERPRDDPGTARFSYPIEGGHVIRGEVVGEGSGLDPPGPTEQERPGYLVVDAGAGVRLGAKASPTSRRLDPVQSGRGTRPWPS